MNHITLLLLGFVLATPIGANEAHQPYAGLQSREISSLSEDDIAELTNGGGWGLALPAELNGYPGPAHVLDLKEQLQLSQTQLGKIQAIFDEMKAEAIAAGQKLIAAERALDEAFLKGDIAPKELERVLEVAGSHRVSLRFVHLSRHIETAKILSPEQIEKYQTLRGYTSDPCKNVPEGHNAAMWLKHNGCEPD